MSDRLSISEAFEIYRTEYIVFRNQSRRTEEMSMDACKSLISFVGDIPIKDLSFDSIRQWKRHLEKEKNRSPNTVRGYIIKLRVVLKYLKNCGYTSVLSPDRIGIPKKVDRVVDFLTSEEVNKLISSVGKAQAGYKNVNRYRNMAIISILYGSGIRNSELCQLNISDIRDDNTFTVVGKGNKVRLCFMDERTSKYITRYIEARNDNSPALFISDNTQSRVTSGTVQEILRNAKKKSNINKVIHPHTLRHSFATNLLKNNTNLMYVKDFLGHSSIQTTQMYTHVVNEDLKKIYLEKHTV